MQRKTVKQELLRDISADLEVKLAELPTEYCVLMPSTNDREICCVFLEMLLYTVVLRTSVDQ